MGRRRRLLEKTTIGEGIHVSWGSIRTRSVLLVALATTAVLTTTSLAGAHGDDTNTIHACVMDANGKIRIVGPNESCKDEESELDWTAAASDLAPLEGRVTDLEADVASLDGRADALETDVAGLGGRAHALETDLANLDGRVTGVETDVANLETRAAALETDVANLQSRATELETDLANLEARVTDVEIGVANLESRATELETDLANLDGRVTALASAPTAADSDRVHTSRLTGQVTVTTTHDPAAIPAESRAMLLIPVSGLETGDMVTVSPPGLLNDDLLFVGHDVQPNGAGGADVIVYLYNASATVIDDGLATWKIQYLDLTP